MQRPHIEPAREPVTLAEARRQCRCDPDDSSEDVLLQGYIAAAREDAEQRLCRRLITQTWQLSIGAWPADDAIVLPQAPVQSVTSIVYTDAAGVQQTVAPSVYALDVRAQTAVVRLAHGQEWPADVRDIEQAITITYVAGYGDQPVDVPESVRAWMLVMVATMYRNREAVGAAAQTAELPYIDRLLDPHRRFA